MDHRLPATCEMAKELSELFVTRRPYTIQSMRPHPESGRHYYYRPKPRDGGEPVALTIETVRRHLAGELTIGIYAIDLLRRGANGWLSTPTTKRRSKTSSRSNVSCRMTGSRPRWKSLDAAGTSGSS